MLPGVAHLLPGVAQRSTAPEYWGPSFMHDVLRSPKMYKFYLKKFLSESTYLNYFLQVQDVPKKYDCDFNSRK